MSTAVDSHEFDFREAVPPDFLLDTKATAYVRLVLHYALTAFLALIAFHRQQWGWIIIVWSCFSFVLAMLLSVLLFREPFTVKRAVASAFVLLAIPLND